MHISHDFIATKIYPSYEFLVVFGQVWVWHQISAGRVRVWKQTQNFNLSRTLLLTQCFAKDH